MRVYRHLGDVPEGSGQLVAYGAFDGLHIGHQRLIAQTGEAGGAWVVLAPCAAPRLSSRRRVLEALRDAPITGVVFGGEGVLTQLCLRLGAHRLFVDSDCSISEPAGAGLDLSYVSGEVGGELVTVNRLRGAVAAGALDLAATLLGCPYAVDGRVVHGFHRGASIGVPTANLRVGDLELPPEGVYAVRVRATVAGGVFDGFGVSNLGRNPTFGNHERSLETHIFDLDADLYGKRLDVAFLQRLRDEQKFEGVEALVAQIHRDIEAAREVQRAYE